MGNAALTSSSGLVLDAAKLSSASRVHVCDDDDEGCIRLDIPTYDDNRYSGAGAGAVVTLFPAVTLH